jgi:hypothetical protein
LLTTLRLEVAGYKAGEALLLSLWEVVEAVEAAEAVADAVADILWVLVVVVLAV